MSASILTSTKETLGVEDDYTAFDSQIVLHINSVFSTLSQLGIGPEDGFMIEDADAKWSEFLGDETKLNAVKTYMYLRVRLLFDPPGTPHAINSFEKQVEQLEWRLTVHHDSQVAETTPTP